MKIRSLRPGKTKKTAFVPRTIFLTALGTTSVIPLVACGGSVVAPEPAGVGAIGFGRDAGDGGPNVPPGVAADAFVAPDVIHPSVATDAFFAADVAIVAFDGGVAIAAFDGGDGHFGVADVGFSDSVAIVGFDGGEPDVIPGVAIGAFDGGSEKG